jgi:Tfp pilus assembly protein PilZ
VSSANDRKHERFKARVRVHFESAADFVVQYAENLSAGGIFVPGVTSYELLSEIAVVIDLPGAEASEVRARVAHVLTEEMAVKYKRPAGTGLEIIESPESFQKALRGFLELLGRRRDSLVLASEEDVHRYLDLSGYRVGMTDLSSVVEDYASGDRVIAVVVPQLVRPEFEEQLSTFPGSAAKLIGLTGAVATSGLLQELDRRLG